MFTMVGCSTAGSHSFRTDAAVIIGFIADTTYPPALMCLLTGAVGIAATFIQLAIIVVNFAQNIEKPMPSESTAPHT